MTVLTRSLIRFFGRKGIRSAHDLCGFEDPLSEAVSSRTADMPRYVLLLVWQD